jgi:peptidoglycan/LPS O-acetylase OafA/YrhL
LVQQVPDNHGGARTTSGASDVHARSIRYRPELDGLRAVAVLAVFVFHLRSGWLRGGFVGVDVFFVISGYLITSILLRDFERNTFSLAKFYQRRIARLFPAFLIVALATLAGAFFIYSAQDLASSGATLTASTLSVANIKFMMQGNYFKIASDAQPFLHDWSLSVEEQFYLLFPATLLFLFLKAKRYRTTLLGILCGVSLVACIAVTHARPTWAFFLLPTRAWELLAGSILASWGMHRIASGHKGWQRLSLLGLALIGASFFLIKEGAAFPGYVAVLPVLGTVFVLGPNKGSGGVAEKLLSWGPMVLIGRMSYSLYLWHWPIFSFVDYKLYLASPLVRLGLKVGLSLAATAACFYLIENPGRVFLNQPHRRRMAFAFLGCALLLLVPLGIHIRNANYINATARDVAHGGLVFNRDGRYGAIVLMGDSNGSMYGKMLRQVADEHGFKLTVISAAAENPLPPSTSGHPTLWTDSLAVVKRERPDYLFLVCNWETKLSDDSARLAIAVDELKQYTGCLVLITQPADLPGSATRASMRNGSRPPFWEDPVLHAARTKANAMVKSFAGGNVVVLDIERHFEQADGRIIFADSYGRLYYYDNDHLSGYGADLVKADVVAAITNRRSRLPRGT